jgi:hypothetical protein
VSKQFCLRGHDTYAVGREKQGNCRQCKSVRLKAWRADHRSNVYQNSMNQGFRVAGILNANGTQFTQLDYDRAYQMQQGCCKGCGKHQSELGRRLDADHDHKTGFFRFLLCANCNRALGYGKDDPAILRQLADLVEHVMDGGKR